jgi:multiple sugar transport system ATP-binding protein
MPILDSQNIGEAVTNGSILDISDFVKKNIDTSVYDPYFLAAYGQYPQNQTGEANPDAKTYGLPLLGDTWSMIWRKDLMGDTPPATMVFQSYALYPKQTAAQNIASPLRARQLPKSEIEAKVKRVAELLHIERLLERKPAQMSGGEMQRVALGRALVREPRAFLMDEPLTNLDLKLRVEMRTELTRIHRSLGRTFLYVTNDQVEAMSMADQVAVLRQGTVQQVGSPTEIYDHPANRWVATFVGSPRMNLLPCEVNGRLEGKGWTLPNPGFPVEGDRRTLLGIRAEDLSLDVREESAALEGTVYAVEPLGDRTLVDIEVGEQRVVIKAAPTTSFQIGEPVRASVDLDRVHLFDAGTESAIARR